MITRLIRWLARTEIESAVTAARIEAERMTQIRLDGAYGHGFNAARALGQGEMLAHLRGEPEERATADMIRTAAAAMVH